MVNQPSSLRLINIGRQGTYVSRAPAIGSHRDMVPPAAERGARSAPALLRKLRNVASGGGLVQRGFHAGVKGVSIELLQDQHKSICFMSVEIQ